MKGNPNYAVELSKSFNNTCIFLLTESIKNNLNESERNNLLEAAIESIKSFRVDEIINLRFAQLSPDCQLTLKAASIAAISDTQFNMPTLAFMLPEFTTIDSSGNIPLLSYVQELCKQSFLVIYKKVDVNAKTRSSMLNLSSLSFTVDMLTNVDILFDFSSAIEQSTIYDLLLNDQKSYFHEKVSLYLESINSSKTFISYEQCLLLANHWEYAGARSRAMCYYYQSGMIFDKMGAIQESHNSLITAYMMFVKFKQNSSEDSLKLLAGSIVDLYLKDDMTADTVATARSVVDSLFNKDSYLFETCLLMLMQYAKSIATVAFNNSLIMEVFDEALVYSLLMTKREDSITDDSINIQDPSILLTVLSNMLHYQYKNQAGADAVKKSSIVNLYMKVSDRFKTALHLTIAKCFAVSFYQESNSFEESVHYLDQLKSLYVCSDHSSKLVDLFGKDVVLITFVSSSFYFLLHNQFDKALEYRDHTISLIDKVNHHITFSILTLQLTSFNLYIKEYSDAFSRIKMMNSIPSGYHSKPYVPYLYYLTNRLASNSTDLQYSEEPITYLSKFQETLLETNDKANKHSFNSQMVIDNNNLEAVSYRSLEEIQAEICVLLAIKGKEKAVGYEKAAIIYLERIKPKIETQSALQMLSYVNVLILEVRLLMFDRNDSNMTKANLILEKGLKLLSDKKLSFLTLLIGYVMIELEINITEGLNLVGKEMGNIKCNRSITLINDINYLIKKDREK